MTDGPGNVRQYNNWVLGVPEEIKLPATPEQPAGALIQSDVAADGTISWVKGEAGDRTCYTYDAMGRTESIAYGKVADAEACDPITWTPTAQAFVQSTAEAFKLPVGHWQQTVSTGNARTVLYFDAFWRPVVEESYDAANPATTRTLVVKRYDEEGRLIFQSYPMATLTDYRLSSLKGVHTQYDALGRVVSVAQDSEFRDQAGQAVPLVTTTAYLSSFRTQVTNPNGKKTLTGFFAQGEPSTELPAWMDQPEGVFTTIERDVLGNPKKVTRSGPGG